MGAWIEIYTKDYIKEYVIVAPFMGAWIEIYKPELEKQSKIASHPLWVRGLKFKIIMSSSSRVWSRTLYGCVD